MGANKPVSLGTWPEGVGNSSDVTVSFRRSINGTVGVTVLSGAMTIFIDFASGKKTSDGVTKVPVGIHGGSPASKSPPLMGSYHWKVQEANDVRYHHRRHHQQGPGRFTDTLQLLPDDEAIALRVFTDRQVVEAYWMDGRVAMTSATMPGK